MEIDCNLHASLKTNTVVSDNHKDDNGKIKITEEPDYPDFMTILLTILSSFIHLTNFYILGLAAKDYSVHVGMEESFSGTLSAVNWSSAVIFTFMYSYWSNFTFRVPTIISAMLVVLGNLFYFSAYAFVSPLMLLLGRFMIGIGGARVLNRRYISTYVAPKARTFWNSAYVAGSIIGRGVGPICAAGLYYLNFSVFGISINGMNSPALLMGLIWSVYFTLLIIYFKEPKIVKKEHKNLENSKSETLTPTYIAMFALIAPKIVHESYVTSIPIVAELKFGWSIDFIGVYIAAVSLAVAPVHIFIAFTSKVVEDRQFIRAALFLTAVGTALLIDFGGMNEIQYILGTIIMYLGMNMDDGVSASLISKVLPPYLATGIFNAGLIVTFAGSLGRGIGGFSIAVAGWVESNNSNMENLIFIPMTALAFGSLLTFLAFYKMLCPKNFSDIR
jgi:MFS family permease